MSWPQALSGNLQRFRSVGLDVQTLSKLLAYAEDLVKTLRALHGYERLSTGNSRLEPPV
jgi:hypothetical protein